MLETKNPAGKGGARDRANAYKAGTPEPRTTWSGLKPRDPGSDASSQDKVEGSHREREDAYRHVVCILSDRWRVIVCRDGLQWIIQRSDGERSGQTRWTGIHYCITREALIRLSRALQPRVQCCVLTSLAALPRKIFGNSK